MSDLVGRVVAIFCAAALSAALPPSCGPSSDQTAEAPRAASEVKTSSGPTPAPETTGSDQTSEDPLGTPVPVTPSAPPGEPKMPANEQVPIVSGLGYFRLR